MKPTVLLLHWILKDKEVKEKRKGRLHDKSCGRQGVAKAEPRMCVSADARSCSRKHDGSHVIGFEENRGVLEENDQCTRSHLNEGSVYEF